MPCIRGRGHISGIGKGSRLSQTTCELEDQVQTVKAEEEERKADQEVGAEIEQQLQEVESQEVLLVEKEDQVVQ